MTKNEIRELLQNGMTLDENLTFRDGQECTIYKADAFATGNQIIYIPDLDLNEIVTYRPLSEEEIEDFISCCYTGDDFVEICDGKRSVAERVFWFCDWQHPSTAYEEDDWEDDESGETAQ